MGIESDPQPNLTGAAGEYYAMCQLLRLGYIAALAPIGVPNADIVVTDADGNKLSAIQVKARRNIGADRGWHMKPKHEKLISSSLVYCFVQFDLDLKASPSCWIVPSNIVADTLTRSHQAWLGTPGRNGRSHQDHAMRRFLPDYSHVGLGTSHGQGWLDPYEENWGLITHIKPEMEVSS